MKLLCVENCYENKQQAKSNFDVVFVRFEFLFCYMFFVLLFFFFFFWRCLTFFVLWTTWSRYNICAPWSRYTVCVTWSRYRVFVTLTQRKVGTIFANAFSNSLIIQEEKTKDITTVKEVWICDPNYHKIWWTFAWPFFLRIVNALRSYINETLERVFDQISKHFEVG